MAKVLGFSGKKQSGKTTAARCVSNACHGGAMTISFVDQLKGFFRDVFVPPDLEWRPDSESCKNQMLPMGRTVREGLQWFGTDVCRAADPDCWVRCWRYSIENEEYKAELSGNPISLILVPDVRFPNELAAIQEMGGHVIRLLRAPFDDRHESETALDEIEAASLVQLGLDGLPLRVHGTEGRMFDAVIDNRDMTIPEQNAAVLNLVTEMEWI